MGEIQTHWSGSDIILNQLMETARVSELAAMASGVAHELNQPLGAIATFSQGGERMLDRPEPLVHRASDFFRQINHEALGAGEGMKRIRRPFEQDSPKLARCQMPELIAEIRPILDILALRIEGCLQLDAPPTLPDLLVDRLRIQRVLFALVQNAADVSTQNLGAPMVRIDVSADRYTVETGVTDSGPGIPADLQDKLLRPFFTTKPQGTGLGLASSRAIVESHEGTIGFDHLPAGGSRFWFRLPVAHN